MNRAIKFALDNAKKDRKDGEDLLKKAKLILKEILELERTGDNQPTINDLATAFQNCISVLGQMGKSNELLLKLVLACDKIMKAGSGGGKAKDGGIGAGSSFSLMEKIAKEQEEDNE